MLEYFFRKYNGKVSKETIKTVYETLTEVNKILPYKDDFEKLMNTYINLEMLKVESQLQKIEIDNTIKKLKKSQYDIINKTIIEKRNSGGLVSYLSNLDDKQFQLLNQLVDLDSEYRIVSDKKFWKDKEMRRRKSGSKSFVIGGSDYSLNQTL